LIGKNGKVISFGFAPHLGFSVDPAQPRFSSLTLVDGKWPGAGEVVIDRSTAHKKGFGVGDTIKIEAQGPATPFRISGLVRFNSRVTLGGGTLSGFDLRTAQKLFAKVGKLDQIRVARKAGSTQAELLSQLRSALPPETTQVKSGADQAESDASDTKSFTDFL